MPRDLFAEIGDTPEGKSESSGPRDLFAEIKTGNSWADAPTVKASPRPTPTPTPSPRQNERPARTGNAWADAPVVPATVPARGSGNPEWDAELAEVDRQIADMERKLKAGAFGGGRGASGAGEALSLLKGQRADILTKIRTGREIKTTAGDVGREAVNAPFRGGFGAVMSSVAGVADYLGADDTADSIRDFRDRTLEDYKAPEAASQNVLLRVGGSAGEALGSTAPYLIGGVPGVTAKVAAGGLAAGGGIDQQDARVDQAREAGKDVSAAQEVTAETVGGLIGLTELLPVKGLLAKVPKGYGNLVVEKLSQRLGRRAAGRILAGATEEGLQEALSGVAQDLTELGIYNADATVGDSALEDFALGGFVGGTIRGGVEVVDKATGRLRSRRDGDSRTAGPGMVEQAIEASATPTPDDEASPLDTGDIATGRAGIAAAQAEHEVSQTFKAMGLPEVGSQVVVTDPETGVVRGTLRDRFTVEDGSGVVIELEDGTTLREYDDVLADVGVTITPAGPLSEADAIDANLAARARAGRISPAQEASSSPVAPAQDAPPSTASEAAPTPSGPVSDGGAIIRSIFGDKARITSGYRGPNHPLSKKNPKSWHARSHAAVDMAPIKGMTFEQAKASIEAQGYTLIEAINEVGKGRTKHATGDHWHFVIGGKGGGAAAAPGASVLTMPERSDADAGPAALPEHPEAAMLDMPTRAAIETRGKVQANPDGIERFDPDEGDTAVTVTGREVPVRYRLAELDSLIASNTPDGAVNPNYPKERQPRDRSRAASLAQVEQIAGNLNPKLLGRSPKAADGAPIIAPDGVVESGNGRTLALQKVYQSNPERADQYRAYLEAEGYDTTGMTKPVLVRVRDGAMSEADVQAFVREANARDTAGMSGTETAASDAEALPAGLLDLYRGGNIDTAGNRDFVRGFMQALVPTNDQATLVLKDGSVAGSLVKRIEAALLVRAIGPRSFIESLIDADAANIKAIGKALVDVSGPLAKLREAVKSGNVDASMDIADNIAEAVEIVERARREERNVADLVNQRDVFSGDAVAPLTEAVLHLFFNGPRFTRPAGRERVAERLGFYIEQAEKAAPGGGLFGELPKAEPGDILALANDRDKDASDANQGNLLAAASSESERNGSDGADVRADGRDGEGQRGEGALPQSAEEGASESVGSDWRARVAANPEKFLGSLDDAKLDKVGAAVGVKRGKRSRIGFIEAIFDKAGTPRLREVLPAIMEGGENTSPSTPAARENGPRLTTERSANPKFPASTEQMPGERKLKDYYTQGWNAAENGWSIEDNPYLETSRTWEEWRKGFGSSDKVETEAVRKVRLGREETAPQGGQPVSTPYTLTDSASGKGLELRGATPAQVEAIKAAGVPIPPAKKDGTLVFSKKREDAVRKALNDLPATDNSPETLKTATDVRAFADEFARKLYGDTVNERAERQYTAFMRAVGEWTKTGDFGENTGALPESRQGWREGVGLIEDLLAGRLPSGDLQFKPQGKPRDRSVAIVMDPAKGTVTSAPVGTQKADARTAGARAWAENRKRIAPKEWIVGQPTDLRVQWYEGWDAANLAAPIEQDQAFRDAIISGKSVTQAVEQIAGKKTVAGKGLIGQNARGEDVFEDENGVRSYIENINGTRIRLTESVGIVPGRGIYVDASQRWDVYKTVSELGAERADKERRVGEEYDALANKMQRAKQELDAFGEEQGITYTGGPIKTRERTIKKVVEEEGYRGAADLKDLVRGAFMVETQAEANRLAAAINERFTVTQDKGWKRLSTGYADHKIIVEIDGLKTEIQIVPKALWDAKKGGGNALYKEQRGDNGPVTEERFAELETQQQELYARVLRGTDFAQFASSSKSASGNSASAASRESGTPSLVASPGASAQTESSRQTSASGGSIENTAASRNSTSLNEGNASTSENIGATEGDSKGSSRFAKNTLFTEDKVEAARARLREKMRRLNSGVDPETLVDGMTIAGAYIEAGVRNFAEYAKQMRADFGENITPFLLSFWEGARNYPGLDTKDMTPPDASRAMHDMFLAGMDASGNSTTTEDSATSGSDVDVSQRLSAGDERPGTEDGEGASQDGGSQRAPGQEGRGSAPTVLDADEGRGNATGQRSSSGPAEGSTSDRASVRDADGVPGDERSGARSGRTGSHTQSVSGTDWLIEPGSLAEDRSPAQKARDNLEAIRIVKQVQAEGRLATRDEQAAIARYVGWGGLANAFPDQNGSYGKGFEEVGPQLRELLTDSEYETARRSIQYAHYTAETVVRAMWDAAHRLGFRGGQVFEPGMGTGNFRGMMRPDLLGSTSYSGLEYDHLTADIAKLLYPQSGVRQADYSETPAIKNAVDLVIGNPPFASTAVSNDAELGKHKFMLHDFFFAKSIEAVKPGGLLMFISSAGTMNKVGDKARNFLADRADLVGAIRLPGNAFKQNAGTEVTTDIVILRKREPGTESADRSWTQVQPVKMPDRDGNTVEGNVNSYFVENPEMVLGEQGMFDKLVAGPRYAVRAPAGFDLRAALEQAIGRLPIAEETNAPKAQSPAALSFDITAKDGEGSFYIGDNGTLMQVRGGVGTEVYGSGRKGGISAANQERIRKLIPIKLSLREVFAADLAENDAAAAEARAKLSKAYDAFVSEFGPINLTETRTQPPTPAQVEEARLEAREEARLSGAEWSDGSFDPEPLLEEGKSNTEIAKARAAAKEKALSAGRTWDEGTFDPEEVPDRIFEKRPNLDPFLLDEEGYRLAAIESYDKDSGTAKKGRIFTQSSVRLDKEPEINGADDALLYSLNRLGRPDLGLIAEKAGKSEDEVLEELGDRLFEVPTKPGTYETPEVYLSGNVREKLETAQKAARRNPAFTRNVRALEAVQPTPLSPSEIHAKLGMSWMPTEIFEQFATERLGLRAAHVKYVAPTATWVVSGDSHSVASKKEWGTDRINALKLLELGLGRQTPKVYDYTQDGKRVFNEVDTQAAQDKLTAITEAFSEWVWADDARTADLVERYNRDFNSFVAPRFDGSYLATPGINPVWKWRPHQASVIARIIQTGNTYMAHDVGSGKTSAMIGAGMEMRRLGLVNKPMYVVPNHMLGQFTKEFYEQYPLAKIRVADEKRFHTSTRKEFVASLATEDLDAVIITHSAFGFIPISNDFNAKLIQDSISELELTLQEAGDDRITRKNIEAQKEKLEKRLKGMKKRADQVFTFEETGVDFLFIDEAHLFRKLDYATKHGNVKGIDPNGSKASFDLFVKTRYLEKKNPGRNLVLASGTPITNTMAELFSVSRYLQEGELRKRGLAHFDAWAAAFGDTVTALEQDPAGGYKPVTRFAQFVNVPELSVMVRMVMDTVTATDLRKFVTLPELKGGSREMVMADKTPLQEDYQFTLKMRMEAIENRSGPPKKGDDILLSVIGDGRKAAIDYRLISPQAKREEGSKLERLIDNVFDRWKEFENVTFHEPLAPGEGYSKEVAFRGAATQMVFADLGINGDFPVHKYIKRQLVSRGVPANQVALISDYKTHVAKQRLFNDMNEGKVRVLIGSVPKMGTGVNAQKRLRATHNLDAQWYPANDVQRNGRIVRQGNMNPEVEILDYSTQGTYDSQMWNLMAKKAKFIEGFMRGDPTLRDIEDLGEASQYEQAQAMTTSDPRIMDLTEWRQELDKLQRRKAAHEREQHVLRKEIEFSRENLSYASKVAPLIEQDIAAASLPEKGEVVGTIDGASFDERVAFGEAIQGALAKLVTNANGKKMNRTLGEYGGFTLEGATGPGIDGPRREVRILRAGKRYSAVQVSEDPGGTVTRLTNAIRKFESELEEERRVIERAENNIASMEPRLGTAFDDGGRMAELRGQIDTLEATLAKETADRKAAQQANQAKDSIPERIVYHGGTFRAEGMATPNLPFFVSENPEFAETYARDRGRGRGRLARFTFTPRKTATEADILAVADYVFGPEEAAEMPAWAMLSPGVNDLGAEEVVRILQEKGFDSAEFYDFRMNSDFAEEKAIAILDPSALSDAGFANDTRYSIPDEDLFAAPQPERSMTQRQRAELEARQKQGMARRGGQQGLGDQEGGLFSSERDQGSLFSRPDVPLVATLRGDEIQGDGSARDRRNRVVQWFKRNLRPKTVTAVDGEKVRFGRPTISKLRIAGDNLLAVFPAVEDILTKGRYAGSVDVSGKWAGKGVVKAHRYEGRVEVAGEVGAYGVLVHELADGRRFYYIDSMPPVESTGGRSSPTEGGAREASPYPMDLAPGDLNLFTVDGEVNEAAPRVSDEVLRAQLAKLGLRDKVVLQIVDTLGGRSAGRFTPGQERLIQIARDTSQSEDFTLNHEVLHALRDMGLFKDSEWKILVARAKREPGMMRSIERRYKKLDAEGREEEAVADLFAKFQRGDFEARGVVAKAFKMLRGVLEAIRNFAQGNGLRTAEGVMRDAADGRIAARDGRGLGGTMARDLIGYHGSPHDHDGFSTEFIGSGEGAQVYGWGLYFATKREIAEFYRRVLSGNYRPEITIDGEPFARFADDHDSRMDGSDAAWDRSEVYAAVLDATRFVNPSATIEDVLAIVETNPSLSDGNIDALTEIRDRLAIRPAQGGRLYEVEIPEPNEYLDWNKSLFDQPANIREAIRTTIPAAIAAIPGNRMNAGDVAARLLGDSRKPGRDIYKEISSMIASVTKKPIDEGNGWNVAGPADGIRMDDKAASLLLLDAGIKGIQYLDGPSRRDGDGSYNYVVFDGADIQITAKESIPPDVDDMLAQAGRSPSWKDKGAEAWDKFRTAMQDRYLPLLRTQQEIERQTGRALPEDMNPYLGEELMSGRIGARLETLMEDNVRPLFDAMADEKVTTEELETYLYARHAPERNARIAEINPEFDGENGSGMSNLEARAVMARIRRDGKMEAMERLAERVDRMRDMALDYRVETGLMSQEDADTWRATYEHYVPLRGFKEVEGDPASAERINRSGGGINVRGKESRAAYGRRSQADSPLAYTILQAEEAIVRGETNRVAQRFIKLARANPDEDFWEVNKVSGRRRMNPETGLVESYMVNQLTAEDKDWTVSAKIDGKEVRVTLNRNNPAARRVADSMRNLTQHQLDWVTQYLGKLNRFLSTVNTSYNPEFVISNALRDIQTATVNLTSEEVDGLVKGTLADYRKALVASTKGAFRKGEGEWRDWYDEFIAEGGRVYFNQVEDIGMLKKRIEREAQLAGAQKPGTTRAQAALHVKRLFLATGDMIDNMNLGVENAVRLSAYKNARQAGMSKQRAASLAKNLTVNFNRRGTMGPAMNAAYLFYNASVQGTTRMITALRSKRARRLLYGVMAAGAGVELLNAMLTGYDDDDESFYDKIPHYEKERNLILMMPGTAQYMKIPLPYGYNVFWEGGRTVSEIARRGGKQWQESAFNLFLTAANSFNPVGGADSLLNLVSPTVLDPVIDLELNKDFTGAPIAPEQNPFDSPDPDHRRYFSSVEPHWRGVAEIMNTLSGGDDVVPGSVSVSPETLEYLFGYAVGGAGRFVERVAAIPTKLMDPDHETTVSDFPFARKVVGQVSPWIDKGMYYDRIGQVDQAIDFTKDYLEREQGDEARSFAESNEALLSMEPAMKAAQKDMRKIRKARRVNEGAFDLGKIDEAAYRAEKRVVDEAERITIERFNKQWNATVGFGRDVPADE